MSDLLKKTKRQIEIAALTMIYPGKYTSLDLEIRYDCNSATIQRDLSALRKRGVDIHSIPGEGLKVISRPGSYTIRQLFDDYVYVGVPSSLSNKSNHFLATILHEKSFSFLAIINIACQDKKEIVITYKKSLKGLATSRMLQPLLLFERDNEWRLLAFESGKVKQFLLSKIDTIELTERSFNLPVELDAQLLLTNSFGAWIGGKNYPVRLLFTKDWLASGKVPLLMEKQTIEYQKDGSAIVSFFVNYLEDVARWVAGRGGEVIVQAPSELIKLVIRISTANVTAHSG
jgi:predicted DNA-binding transcriptional regulator YafY